MPSPLYFANDKLGVGTPNPQVEVDVVGDAAITGNLAVAGTITSGGQPVGSLTLAAVGSAPNANAASYSSGTLNLQPADATHPGVVTTGGQTLAGAKKFTSKIDVTSVDASHPLIGGDFAAGFGIAFPTSDNSIYYRTGGASGGSHFFTDVGGNQALQVGGDGKLTVGGSFTAAHITVPATDASGTPGPATINKMSGRAAIANGASTCTITNSLVTAASIVRAQLEAAGKGVGGLVVAPGSGSFVVTSVIGDGTATNVTADCTFSFVVIN